MKPLTHFTHPVARRLAAIDGRLFYIGLALALAAWAAASLVLYQRAPIQERTYDWMMKHRFHTPAPDPDIVILDIDEKSLAQMSKEFGRWPWPRDVLGAVLAELESQGAQAVVFDILFSDPDKQNAASDKAFSDAITASRTSFFPVLRLNPENDSESLIRASRMTGLVSSASSETKPVPERTLALVPPYFETAVASGRLGTHNVTPDRDGVIRRYHLWEDVDGWRIASMPQRLASAFDWPAQARENRLLQWMAIPLAHKTVSFSDLYLDSQKQKKTRSPDEFKDKIVLIGSTAPSLFDVKGTPLAAIHPGVDILATAIDNTKHDNFLNDFPPWTQLAITSSLLVLMAWLSIRYSHEQLAFAFLIAPSLLLVISYLSLNFSNTFIDLSGPASIALLYFSLVQLYGFVIRQYWSGHTLFSSQIETGCPYHVVCMAVLLPHAANIPAFETRFFNLMQRHAPNGKVTLSLGNGLGWLKPALQEIIVATWVNRSSNDSEMAHAAMHTEADRLMNVLSAEFPEQGGPRFHFVERSIVCEPAAGHFAPQLRSMILDALHRI